MRSTFARLSATVLIAGVMPVLPAVVHPAAAVVASNPGYTLQGCRQDGTILLPDADGKFICPDAAYTTGNLGKNWNELDLVPHRLTLAKPDAGTFVLNLGGDNLYTSGSGAVGWDVVSVPVLNVALSGSNCPTVSAGPNTIVAGSNGGASTSIQEAVTFTSASNASADCVYDYYQRLALGAHLYAGSSLQSYVNSTYSGEKRISLPVQEALPQELSKTMTAVQDGNFAWTVAKQASPAVLTFSNTCTNVSGSSATTTITVTWTKVATAADGNIHVVTTISATNPAARTVTVTVTDHLRSGTTELSSISPQSLGPVDVPANSTATVGTLTWSVPSGTTNLNDVAVGSYTDKVTGVPIPQTTQATASATVASSGVNHNNSATISDTESITGSGFTFSVDSTTPSSFGSFGTYVLGTHTAGPVNWNGGTVTSGGSIAFHKTVYAAYGTSASASLDDTATLDPSDTAATTDNASVTLSSTALGTLSLTKTIPNILQGSETVSFTFHVSTGTTYDATHQVSGSPLTFTFTAGETTHTQTLSGLAQGSYTIHEDPTTGWSPQLDVVRTFSAFVPGTGANPCLQSARVDNSFGPPSVQAIKVTVPAGSQAGWDMVLTRPDLSTTTVTTDANGVANFGNISDEGAYSIAEVPKNGWDQTSATGDGCSFTVNLPADNDHQFVCTITNTLRGRIIVTKVTQPAGSTQSFTFVPSYEAGFSLTDGQSNTSALLVPGTGYSVSENATTGWQLLSSSCVDGASHTYAPSAITLLPGQTVNCVFTNRQYGHVRVIKTFSGAAPTGTQAFTFQLRTGASSGVPGTVVETQIANAGNGGVITFTTNLTPGASYQLCETGIPVAGHSSLEGLTGYFVPNGDNSEACVPFTVDPGQLKVFTIDNTPPPGGDARTIGYWKNWSSCKTSNGKQAPVLDRTLYASGPAGITLGLLVLHGGLTPDSSPDCVAAVRILNKSRVDTGAKMASDPAFGLAAQLLAAKLNIVAGAASCAAANTAISAGSALLLAINFNGSTHTAMTPTQTALARSLASTLDQYNNNLLC